MSNPNPGVTIVSGRLVAVLPDNLPWWMKRDTTDHAVVSYCSPCGLGIRTAWPASVTQLEERERGFAKGHERFCPCRPAGKS